jgi:RNA polymerase sigma factor (sigma-70 family)
MEAGEERAALVLPARLYPGGQLAHSGLPQKVAVPLAHVVLVQAWAVPEASVHVDMTVERHLIFPTPGLCDHGHVELASLPDARLVARCRVGDQDAWRELVRRFSRYVYAITSQAFRLRPEDAEDVFQEVFARTYEHLDRLRDDEAIRPWIGQLTRRLCIDRLRATSREEPSDVDPVPPGSEQTVDLLNEAFDVHEAMAELPEHCQEILDRFFARDESYQTIGNALDIPSGTIASRISRCLAKLRDLLEGRNPPGSPSSGR